MKKKSINENPNVVVPRFVLTCRAHLFSHITFGPLDIQKFRTRKANMTCQYDQSYFQSLFLRVRTNKYDIYRYCD